MARSMNITRLAACLTAWLAAGALSLLAPPASAQIQLGETSAKANGTLSSGYTSNYGNLTGSTHSWTLGGAGTFSGSFHSPNFLSFNISPYLNQSRANSNFQSISDASGVNLSANIFAGSRFPGSLTYAKAYNSEGNYSVPGLANYVTHGNSDTFGVNWSENLPDLPSFSAGFQMGTSSYSVYGTSDQGNNSFHSLNLHSGYDWQGFNMGAFFTKGGGHSQIPLVVAGQLISETQTDNTAYGFNATHKLPLQGSASATINRSEWSSDYLGSNTSGTIDTINALAGVHPTQTLALSASLSYSDNLSGQLLQSVVTAGGVPEGLDTSDSSNSLDVQGIATYTPLPNVQTSAFIERRSQTYLGEDYGVTSYGGSATYSHALLNGTINGAVSVTANSANVTGEDTLGFSANANYTSIVLGWHVSGSFGYAQNAQTLLVTYMNSYYNYSANASRHWGQFIVSAGAGGARTALTQQAGVSNSSESYNASMGYGRWITGTGAYSKSDGQALATGAGLVPVPVPSPALPAGLVSLFGGDSYSFGLSSSPAKGLILAASYGKAISNTIGESGISANQNSQFNSIVQYQYRKLYFTSGYARLEQGFSGSGTPPEIISSYYFGVSRWFNFF